MKINMHYYPIALNLKNRVAIVIGGGKVAERKIIALLDAGAKVKVISPEVTPSVRRMAEGREVRWIKKNFNASDLCFTHIVIAATSDSAVNKKVSQAAREYGIPVNVVDQTDSSDFISPAVLRRGKSIIAVYTNGRDPVLSRDLKNFLKRNWNAFLSYRDKLQNSSA